MSFAKTYRHIHFLIRALGMDGIVMETKDLSNLIQESGLLTFAGGGHKVLLGKWRSLVGNKLWAKMP